MEELRCNLREIADLCYEESQNIEQQNQEEFWGESDSLKRASEKLYNLYDILSFQSEYVCSYEELQEIVVSYYVCNRMDVEDRHALESWFRNHKEGDCIKLIYQQQF